MILKELTIEQFGKIEHFDVLFQEQVTAITAPDTESIVKAIGLTTNNKRLIEENITFDAENGLCSIRLNDVLIANIPIKSETSVGGILL